MTQDISALLAELKSLHAKATEGEWVYPPQGWATSGGNNGDCVAAKNGKRQSDYRVLFSVREKGDEQNAQFIVSLHNAFPALVAAIEAAGEDAEILNWAETHPESAMKELVAWWTTCGPGAREIRFEFRNILRAEINRAREAG